MDIINPGKSYLIEVSTNESCNWSRDLLAGRTNKQVTWIITTSIKCRQTGFELAEFFPLRSWIGLVRMGALASTILREKVILSNSRKKMIRDNYGEKSITTQHQFQILTRFLGCHMLFKFWTWWLESWNVL